MMRVARHPAPAPPVMALARQIEASVACACLKSVAGRIFVGRWLRLQRLEVHPVTSSRDVVLVYRVRGTSTVERWYGGRLSARASRPGRVTVMPDGRASSWRVPDPVEVLHLYVPGATIARLAEHDLGIDPARVEVIDSFSAEDPVGAALARSALMSLDESAAGDGLLLDAVGEAVAIHLLRRHAVLPPSASTAGENPNALSAERLRRVCDHVEAHIGGELTLGELAAAACLSTYHLSRCFRRATGVTLHGYVMARRAKRARELLRDPKLTLAEIAYRCGFSSQSHFNAVFKKAVGLTPGNYRRTALL